MPINKNSLIDKTFCPWLNWRLVVSLLLAGNACAQTFSLALNDNDNPFDAPIPGYVGPAGEGKVYYDGFTPESYRDNYTNPLFLSWADSVAAYLPANGSFQDNDIIKDDENGWLESANALGPVTGNDVKSIVSLGDLTQEAIDSGADPGSLTVQFSEPIRNFDGADFAVFENAFVGGFFSSGGVGIGGVFAELAFVEVSSNGVDFARFPAIDYNEVDPGGYGTLDPTRLYNLVGKHANHRGETWGTPFDLSQLAMDPLVLSGEVNLNAITHVRIVDIPGSGDFLDSLGNPILDPWTTFGSGGADIEAIGAIGQELTYADWCGTELLDKDGNEDRDPWTNLEEYAYRLNPHEAEWPEIPKLTIDENSATKINFPRDVRNQDVIYIVEYSADLSENSWKTVARFGPLDDESIGHEIVERVEIIYDAPQVTVGVLQTVCLTLTSRPNQEFYRIRVEESI